MSKLPYNALTIGARNLKVYLLRQLVQYKLTGTLDLLYPHPVVFDRDLYDKATNLSETKSLKFKYTSNAWSSSSIMYGSFNGVSALSSYDPPMELTQSFLNGTPLSGSISGWFTPVNNNTGLFSTYVGDEEFEAIIASRNFTPLQIVEDFEPLLTLLKTQLLSSQNGSIVKDTNLASSLAASLIDNITDAINDTKHSPTPPPWYDTEDYEVKWKYGEDYSIGYLSAREKARDAKALAWYIAIDAYYTYTTFKGIADLFTSNPDQQALDYFYQQSYNFQPQQIGQGNYYLAKNTSIWNDVQAIIYTLNTNGIKDEVKLESLSPLDALICFQTPDSISYTASASYESSSPRGSQTPFQFYQNANQIELSFTLKWHIDEVRSLSKLDSNGLILGSGSGAANLQDIANLAEDFTRPWETSSSSLTPKLCKVILPSVSEIGYITSVNITYAGEMTGDLSSIEYGSGVVLSDDKSISLQTTDVNTSYTYNTLEIAFSMLVIKDTVKLRTLAEAAITSNRITFSPSQFSVDKSFTSIIPHVDAALKAAQLTQTAANNTVSALNSMIKAVSDYMGTTPEYIIPSV